jgi:transposase
MLKDLSQECLKSKPSALKRLGIDEIAWVKGQGNYCAVLIDLDRSKLIGILPERTQEKIKEVLTQWGTEVLEQIEEVSIDRQSTCCCRVSASQMLLTNGFRDIIILG